MSIKTEFSRLIAKRSTVSGVVPTIPASSELDETWLSTDIYVGEWFINVADERVFYRSTDGIVEVTNRNGFGRYLYDATTSAPPGAGEIRFDNATVSSATNLYIFDSDVEGVDRSPILAIMASSDYFIIQDANDTENYALITLGSPTDNTTYYTFAITTISVTGTFTDGAKFNIFPLKASGGGGGGGSIMTSNNTMTSNQTQTLTGFIQSWLNGTFATTGTNINHNQGTSRFNEQRAVFNEYSLGNTSTALSLDLSKGNYFVCTANDNFTLNFTNAPTTIGDTMSGELRIVQDATGSRVLTLGTNVISQGGVTPLLTTTANAEDVLYFTYRQRTGDLYVSVTNDWK